jgi:hypothetical protein
MRLEAGPPLAALRERVLQQQQQVAALQLQASSAAAAAASAAQQAADLQRQVALQGAERQQVAAELAAAAKQAQALQRQARGAARQQGEVQAALQQLRRQWPAEVALAEQEDQDRGRDQDVGPDQVRERCALDAAHLLQGGQCAAAASGAVEAGASGGAVEAGASAGTAEAGARAGAPQQSDTISRLQRQLRVMAAEMEGLAAHQVPLAEQVMDEGRCCSSRPPPPSPPHTSPNAQSASLPPHSCAPSLCVHPPLPPCLLYGTRSPCPSPAPQSIPCPPPSPLQLLHRERMAQVTTFREQSAALQAAIDALEGGLDAARQQVGSRQRAGSCGDYLIGPGGL